jgi:uncharacterized protein (TIGR03437 family)
LKATISPSSATGKITFYNGAAVLGTGQISAGAATLSVNLSTGTRSLFSRYLGDSTYASSESPVVQQIVKSVAGFGFNNSSQPLGTDAVIAAVADFNGDGKPDIVAVGYAGESGKNLSVILGKGAGTFGAPISSLVEGEGTLSAVAVADFNEDGKPDIVVANPLNHNIGVLLGNGDGTFGPPTDYLTVADGRIVVADFNNDGNPDIAVAHMASSSVGILLGNGDGTFAPPHEYPTTNPPVYIVAGDLNGDGAVDLATANNNSLSLLVGNGDGTFASPAILAASPVFASPYQGLSVGDLNGDGILDLVTANPDTSAVGYGATSLSVYLGHGDGTFAAPVVYLSSGTSGTAVGMTIVDVNGDGNADLVTVYQAPVSGTVQVFPGNGDGTLQPAAAYDMGFLPFSLAVADFNGDGKIDLAIPSGSSAIEVLTGDVGPFLRATESHAGDFAPGLTGTFTIQVSNSAGAATTSGTVTVTNPLIPLTASGDGWACAIQSCTRSDALGPNESYPPITAETEVDVVPGTVLFNEAIVSGGGSPVTEARDSVTVSPPPNCTLAATQNSATFGAEGGSGSVTVTVATPCVWNVEFPPPSWITITSALPVTGSGTLTYTIAANTGADARTDTLLLGVDNSSTSLPLEFNIIQAGTQQQQPPPEITSAGIAGTGTEPIAPNTWVQIFGVYLTLNTRSWEASDFVNGQMPTELDGVSVTVNGKSAYVAYISPKQVNVLTPPDLAQGYVPVQLTNNGSTSAVYMAQVEPLAPAFFVFGSGPYVAATHADGTYIGPTSLLPGLTTPAKPGEVVVLYANGFGPTVPPVVAGSSQQSGILSPSPVVDIGGTPAVTQFAGLISPGLYQLNVVVPASTPGGDNLVTANPAGQYSVSTGGVVFLTVQR